MQSARRTRLWIRASPCSGLLRHNGTTTWMQLHRTCRPIYRCLSYAASVPLSYRDRPLTLFITVARRRLYYFFFEGCLADFPDNSLADFSTPDLKRSLIIDNDHTSLEPSWQPWHRNRLGSSRFSRSILENSSSREKWSRSSSESALTFHAPILFSISPSTTHVRACRSVTSY